MKNRIVASVRALPLALMLAAAPVGAQVQQSSVVDDLLKRAQDAYNDLNFLRADTLANQVLSSTGRITASQRTKADRRHEGERRQHRNERSEPSRFVKRPDGTPAQRPEGGRGKRPFRGRRRFAGGGARAA